jgi:hypothetical protein
MSRRLVVALGLSQLLCWGVSYYLVGVFGAAMAADLGHGLTAIHGGFTVALIVQGLVSNRVGRAIDQHGGRPVMVAGSLVMAVSLLGLAAARELIGYYAAWIGLGLAMRMTLYDAAFAALARIGGREARRPIAQITLLGGLASSVLWPVGQALADGLGWRGALCVYAGIALLTIPLHRMIPNHRHVAAPAPESDGDARPAPRPPGASPAVAGALYAVMVALTGLLNSGMSAHMIGLMAGLGLAPALAVWVSTLRGVGQSAARLAEVLFGTRLSPFGLATLASALLASCFLAPLLFGMAPLVGVLFALLFGAGNGLLTIVRGTLPLALFDPANYGSAVGRLITPGFYVAALAPMLYALVIERCGETAALWLSLGCAVPVLLAALLLKALFHR